MKFLSVVLITLMLSQTLLANKWLYYMNRPTIECTMSSDWESKDSYDVCREEAVEYIDNMGLTSFDVGLINTWCIDNYYHQAFAIDIWYCGQGALDTYQYSVHTKIDKWFSSLIRFPVSYTTLSQ